MSTFRQRDGRCRRAWAVLGGVSALLLPAAPGAEPARHVILCIGDGMGPAQVEVGRCFLGGPLSFEAFPHQGTMTTASANALVTDSAAAATAMATGRKVNNGVLSVAAPGDGHAFRSIAEWLHARAGRSLGLVTTSYLTDATPAAFAAHEPSRGNQAQIAADYLGGARPQVLLGGGGLALTPGAALGAGYAVATNRADLLLIPPAGGEPIAGLFGTSSMPYVFDGPGEFPSLEEMTGVALAALAGDTNGFLLVVEGGRIDHACHGNDLDRCIAEVLAFSRAVAVVTNWAAGRADTLVAVTADHETGGLLVLQDRGPGTNPAVAWATGGHTATPVPVYAWGANAELATNVADNTGIFDFLVAATLGAPLAMEILVSETGVVTQWAGAGGHTCQLQRAAAPAATNWQTLATVYAATGPLTLQDTNPPTAGAHVYRLQAAR